MNPCGNLSEVITVPYKTKQEVQTRVEQHYKKTIELGYEVVGIFLQGSWNYELGYEGSDVDTKAIVLPSFDDFVRTKSPISHTHVLENNEHIDLKDIRVMLPIFKKQNMNFIEILFTKYKILNSEYEAFFQPLFKERERIARYNDFAAINAQVGMIYQKYKALEHPYPTIVDKIKKFGYDPKQLHHILRSLDFLERFIEGEPYEKCLIPKRKEYILEVKKGIHTLDEARSIALSSLKKAEKLKQDYFDLHKKPTIDEDISFLLDDVMTSILKDRFVKELTAFVDKNKNL